MGPLTLAMAELEEKRVLELVRKALNEQVAPLTIIEECRQGMKMVGDRYAAGEYFLCDLVMSAEIFQEVLGILDPFLASPPISSGQPERADIVFGTVEGDIHDIGKNITISLLRCEGFRVFDAGVDIPPEEFLNIVKQTGARVLGLSALLSTSFEAMRRTVQKVRTAAVGQEVKVVIGGLVDERVCRYVGADAWVREAVEGVAVCRRWLGMRLLT
ncbi:Methionine synthase [Moorella humiferrea]|uniref:Methionine synthase n=1 Tax=Neomoorella humiferrea TaxID=676965 RepID=A0A2T0ASS7_9FIRM|nr:cobalamin-dependent protein [Moorella humiferrea]PRR73307.1 Methionine synthase [Moorella humiferrea]